MTVSCVRKRRLVVGMVEMVELVPGNGRWEQTKEIGFSWSVVIAGEVEKSGIIQEKGAPHTLS
jgi:hypothetical protein